MEIKVVFIPFQMDKPIEVQMVERSDLTAYQKLVGGLVETTALWAPRATLFMCQEARRLELPINPRANRLAHSRHGRLSENNHVRGDCFVTGPVDGFGFERPVSDRYIWELGAKP